MRVCVCVPLLWCVINPVRGWVYATREKSIIQRVSLLVNPTLFASAVFFFLLSFAISYSNILTIM